MDFKSIDSIKNKYYKDEDHAFQIFERKIWKAIDEQKTVLDAGCGATAPVLKRFVGRASKLIGVDLVEFDKKLTAEDIICINCGLENIHLENSSVDLVISRSVLEHVRDPDIVYSEIYRVLKSNGKFIFLVPNLWDYHSLLSMAIPNRFHPFIVKKMSGRKEDDTFPTYYKSNTKAAICRLAKNNGFQVTSLEYIGQYPYMFTFSKTLFLLATGYDKIITNYEFARYLRGWILAELVKT